MRRLVAWLGLGLLIVAGLASLLAWQRTETPAEGGDTLKDLVVPVGEESSSMVTASILETELTEEVKFSIGPIQGRVTALGSIGPIRAGDTLLSVDGLDRPVLISELPLWRPLTWATEGPDVSAVSSLLVGLGFLDSEQQSEHVDATFVRAVRAFEDAVGWPRTGVFRPEYVVWFPPGSDEFSAFAISLGEVIQPESVVAIRSPEVRSARAVRRDGSGLELTDVGQPWEFVVANGPVVPVDLDGSVEQSLSLLADYIDQESGTIAGVTRLSSPVDWQTVPGASIVADDEGTTCVILSDGQTWPVTVIGSSLGVTRIVPTLPQDAEVMASPDPFTGTCGDPT